MRLDLIVGPNGAGKSTFAQLVIAPTRPRGLPFVNADVIAAHNWPAEPSAHAYEAAELAARARAALIEARQPFLAETVFSHPSKLDLIRGATGNGYTVALHVILVPVDLAVLRVGERVANHGHPVPEHKIRERYGRLWDLVVVAVDLVDTATFYDNSNIAGPREVALFNLGMPVGPLSWPPWTPAALTTRWPPRQ